LQIWLKPNLQEMGWNSSNSTEAPIQGAYVQPFNTWADMTHLLDRELWPPHQRPGALAYFCGPLDEPTPRAPFSDHGFPQREDHRVKATAHHFLSHDLTHLWPKAMVSGSHALDFKHLADHYVRAGEELLDAHYYRANIEPSDRYVLSVKG